MKRFSILLIIIILFNFIFCNCYVYADDTEEDSQLKGSTLSGKDFKKFSEDGTMPISGEDGDSDKKVELGTSDVSTVGVKTGMLAEAFIKIPLALVSYMTENGGLLHQDSEYSAGNTHYFTINSLVFGEYLIFDTKPYKLSKDYLTGDSNGTTDTSFITSTMDEIKETAMGISKFCKDNARRFALLMFAIALVKTVKAKTKEDLTAWKKIFGSWVLCLFLIYFYQYIFVAIDSGNDILVNTFWNMRISLEQNGDYKGFEYTIEKDITKNLENESGLTYFGYIIEFLFLIIMQFIYIIVYILRTFSIIFMYAVAPIIIVIHSFKLMLGRESNGLWDFFKKYISLTYMQSLHALFYLIFIFTLSEIAIIAPILGIVLLLAIYRAENVTKAMIGLE